MGPGTRYFLCFHHRQHHRVFFQALRTALHETEYAAQLPKEQRSIVEDIAGARLPLCIASQNTPSRVTPRQPHPNASVHSILLPLPLDQKWNSSVPSPVVHAVSLSLSDVLAVHNATRWFFSAFSLLCAPVAPWDAYRRGSSRCFFWFKCSPSYLRVMSATTLSCGPIVVLDCSDPRFQEFS